MIDLVAIFRAGFVRRWHTNPDLAHTADRIDGHSARVARIILALHPEPSLDLIRAALTHDDGENAVGDVKAPAKDEFPVIADALDEMEHYERERLWAGDWCDVIGGDDRRWLKFADRLDAYMWAAHHAPHVLSGDGWPGAWGWIEDQSVELGCYYTVQRVGLDLYIRRARYETP